MEKNVFSSEKKKYMKKKTQIANKSWFSDQTFFFQFHFLAVAESRIEECMIVFLTDSAEVLHIL